MSDHSDYNSAYLGFIVDSLGKIERHLAVIAQAASLKITHAGYADKSANRKRLIADEDRPTERHVAMARSLGIDIGTEWPKFKAYCEANDKRYVNFDAAFRKWLLSNKQGNFR